MSTGFIKKLDPPHSFPFITNTRAILGRPTPFSQVSAPTDLSGIIQNSICYTPDVVVIASPKKISDLILWLDANDTSTFIDNNYKWIDKSSNTYTTTYKIYFNNQASSFTKVRRKNLTYVDATAYGVVQVLSLIMRPIFTMFFVGTSQLGLFDIEHSSARISTTAYPLYANPSGFLLNGGGNVPANEFFIFCFGYDPNSNTNQYRINGVNFSTYQPNTKTPNTDTRTSTLTIMGWTNVTLLPALLGEFLIYDKSLSQDDCEKIEAYLARKWNLSSNLPDSHPYKTSALYLT